MTQRNPTFRPLVLIPVYNHPDKIETLINAVTAKSLPCLLINDGSDAVCSKVLLDVTAAHPTQVELVQLEKNQGKGAAVCKGLSHALKQGYSHALQIDADGQHDLNDIEAFLTLGQQNPDAVISGFRPYQQMPDGRRYGRLITDIWVYINTLSNSIKDSMCGYRLYPLAETCTLIEKQSIARRMDFDTDIIVRLYWQGLEVKHINTTVAYDQENTSHFDMLRDNFRISQMHAKLFFGMLLRIPSLLKRHR